MSKPLFKQPLFYTTVLSLLALGLIIASYVFGWTTPTASPPAGNVVLSQGALPAGSPGYVQFASSSTAFGADANFFWDNTNKRLGIGTTAPGEKLEVAGNIKLSGSSPTYKITNVATPTASSDVATKGYVDAAVGGECYTNFGQNTCASGFTAVLTGYTTFYVALYSTTAYGNSLQCSPIAHDANSGTYFYIYGQNSPGRFTQVNNEPCAICCK